MKRKPSLYTILTLLPLFNLIVCAGCVKDPELIDIDSVEIVSLVDSVLEANVWCLVRNPNGVNATVKNITADLDINGAFVGKIDQQTAISIEKKQTAKVKLHAFIQLEKMSAIFPDLLKQELTPVKMTGTARIDAGPADFNKKLNITKELPVQEMLEKLIEKQFSGNNTIQLKKIAFRKAGILHSELFVESAVTNPLGIDFELDKLELDIYLEPGGNPIAKWVNAEEASVPMKSGTETLVSGVTKVDNVAMFSKGMMSFLFKKEAIVRGIASISLQKNRFDIPFNQTVAINFDGF